MLIACGSSDHEKQQPECPVPPDRLKVLVDAPMIEGQIILGHRWQVGGGPPGDRRSASGLTDTTLIESVFCELARLKVNTEPGMRRCVTAANGIASPISIRGTESAPQMYSVVPACSPRLDAIAANIIETFSPRLPPPQLPPVEEYRRDIRSSCRAPEDFRVEVTDEVGSTFTIVEGRIRNQLGESRVQPRALDQIACEILRYDPRSLPINEEGRTVICKEGAQRYNLHGIRYAGIAVDVFANDVERRLRVGACREPLDLHDHLRTWLDQPRAFIGQPPR